MLLYTVAWNDYALIKMPELHLKSIQWYWGPKSASLNGIHMSLSNGIFGLLGPNGAGKTTLMNIITGGLRPKVGSITMNGIDVLENPQYLKQRLGYLPQEFGVYLKLSAFQLMDHLAVLKGIRSGKERLAQSKFLLEKVHLSKYAHQAVSTYSGGMRQRFGLAQALLGQPELLVIDEPTAGLDPEERLHINELILEQSQSSMILLSTHLVEDVRQLCTRMAIMKEGSLIVNDSPENLIHSLHGKIWEIPMSSSEIRETPPSIVFLRKVFQQGKLFARVYADGAPISRAELSSPSLEDAYFYLLNQNLTGHA